VGHQNLIDMTRVWCVIPIFNEEEVLQAVLDDLKTKFTNILCVDDGSRDASFQIASRIASVALRHCTNLGQGAALETGFAYLRQLADVEYVITIDSDGQHSASDAQRLLDELVERDLDVIFGSRFQTQNLIPIRKRVVLQTVVWLRQLLFKSKLTDTNNGLRVLRIEAVRQISLNCAQMAHALEFESKVQKSNLNFGEHPVSILYTDYSTRKGQSVLNAVNILRDFYARR